MAKGNGNGDKEEPELNPIFHPSGLRFLPPTTAKDSSAAMMQCWGRMLETPQFDDAKGFADALKDLDEVTAANVKYGYDGDWYETPDYKAIVSKVSHEIYSMRSDQYLVVQDREVVSPLVEAVKQRKLKPVGRVDGVGSGETTGHIVFANPEFQIELLKEYKDPVMLGVRFWNSYTGALSFGAEVFGVRMICVNYNLWGDVLGEFDHIHKKTPEELLKDYNSLIDSMLDKSDKLQGLAQNALHAKLQANEVEDLLWAIELPDAGFDAISTDFAAWCPESKKLGTNAWTLYNAATAYISWRKRSGTMLSTTDWYARSASKLLTESHDRLIEHGRNLKAKWLEEQEEEEEAEKETVKVTTKKVVKEKRNQKR